MRLISCNDHEVSCLSWPDIDRQYINVLILSGQLCYTCTIASGTSSVHVHLSGQLCYTCTVSLPCCKARP